MPAINANVAGRCLLTLLAVFGFATTCLCAEPATRPAAIDQSSPKAAAIAFWNAIDQGDAATARQLCIADKAHSDFVDSFAAMCGGWRRMSDTRIRKFKGTEELHTPAHKAVKRSGEFEAQIAGDEAVVVVPDQRERGTLTVRKEGKWFLDLNRSTPSSDIREVTAFYRAIGAAANQVAEETEQGKYTSAAEVELAFRAAVGKVIPKGAADQPATRPQ
jgi:hypothetical protein